MVQHKAVQPADPTTPLRARPVETPESLPSALGTAIRNLPLLGRMMRLAKPDIEAMILFASYLEKRLHLHLIGEIRPEHVTAFIRSPVIQKLSANRTHEQVMHSRANGAHLLLNSIQQTNTNFQGDAR